MSLKTILKPGNILKSFKRWVISRNETPWISHFLILTSTICFYLEYQPAFGYPTFSLENWHSIITHMFSHGSERHLFGNMFILTMIAPYIERTLGRYKLLAAYVICGLGACLLYAKFTPNSLMLGASGAISGLMAIYVMQQRTLLGIGLAFLFVGSQFGSDLYMVMNPQIYNGVANLAHLGGAVTGLFVLVWFKIWKE